MSNSKISRIISKESNNNVEGGGYVDSDDLIGSSLGDESVLNQENQEESGIPTPIARLILVSEQASEVLTSQQEEMNRQDVK